VQDAEDSSYSWGLSAAPQKTEVRKGASGIAEDKALDQLSPAETRSWCDWLAEALGGYGYRESCTSDATQAFPPPDQATCVQSLMEHPCSATISEQEKCIRAIATDPCNGKTIVMGPVCAGRC
jgi:hypothetical protein